MPASVSEANAFMAKQDLRATADVLVDGGGEVKILAALRPSLHRPGHKRPIAGWVTKNVMLDLQPETIRHCSCPSRMCGRGAASSERLSGW